MTRVLLTTEATKRLVLPRLTYVALGVARKATMPNRQPTRCQTTMPSFLTRGGNMTTWHSAMTTPAAKKSCKWMDETSEKRSVTQ